MLGAGFSVLQGIEGLLGGEPIGGITLSLSVLGIALPLEGTSWARAVWQLHTEAASAGSSLREHLLEHAEPTVRAVFFEDTAAVIGILLAGAGITLDA